MQLQQEQLSENIKDKGGKADLVEITFYTDPLCCWSWAIEPQWRKLQFEYRNNIRFRYVMSGLIPSWKNYNDPVFSVSRPQQMGPVWMEAASISGMPLQHKIWVNDPPASSYPACIAVKCAELQSGKAAIKYLRLLREAVMISGHNVAKQEVLTQVAQKLSLSNPKLLDLEMFSRDLTNGNGIEAFRIDLNEVQSRNISRFPTLIFRSNNKPALMMTGYNPYTSLEKAIKQLIPEARPVQKATTAEDYRQYWDAITEREIAEALVD